MEEVKQTNQVNPSAVSEPTVASVPAQTNQVAPEEKSKLMMWLLIAVGVVIVVVVGFVVYSLVSGDESGIESFEETIGDEIIIPEEVPLEDIISPEEVLEVLEDFV